jgi:hypothetical protein
VLTFIFLNFFIFTLKIKSIIYLKKAIGPTTLKKSTNCGSAIWLDKFSIKTVLVASSFFLGFGFPL